MHNPSSLLRVYCSPFAGGRVALSGLKPVALVRVVEASATVASLEGGCGARCKRWVGLASIFSRVPVPSVRPGERSVAYLDLVPSACTAGVSTCIALTRRSSGTCRKRPAP